MLEKTINIFLFFCIIAIPCRAQTYQEIIDSLQQVLSETTDQRLQVDMLNDISYSYRRSSERDSIFFYADKAKKLAEEIGYLRGQSIAHKNIGIWHYKIASPPDSARYHYNKALLLAKDAGDYYTQAACLNNLGLVCGFTNDLSSGIKYYLEGVEIFDHHFKENLILKGLLLGNLGMAYVNVGDSDKAYEYLKRTVEFGKENNYKPILAQYMDNYADILIDRGEIELAESIIDEALIIQKEIGDQQSRNPILVRKLEILMSKGEFQTAKTLAEEALAETEQKNYQAYASFLFNKLIEISIGLNDQERTLEYATQLEGLDLGFRSFHKNSYESLAKAYAFTGNHKKANRYLKNVLALSDTIRMIEQTEETAKLEAAFQLRERKAEIEALNKEKETEKEKARLLTSVLILSILLIGGVIYQLYKRNQKNKIIAKKNQELQHYIDYNLQLENFAYIAAHDLKTPLRNIVSFTQVLKSSSSERLEEKEKNYLKFIETGSKEMSLLLDDLYAFAQNNRKVLQVESIQMEAFMANLLQKIDVAIKESKAEVHYKSNHNTINADPIKLNQLLQNLILNGLKFQKADNQPIINISLSEQGKNWLFKVSDNGIGMDEKFSDKVFMIFKRLHKKEEFEGTGIGLAICQKIVEQHGGKIWFNSTLGKGTTFFFTIPSSLLVSQAN